MSAAIFVVLYCHYHGMVLAIDVRWMLVVASGWFSFECGALSIGLCLVLPSWPNQFPDTRVRDSMSYLTPDVPSRGCSESKIRTLGTSLGHVRNMSGTGAAKLLPHSSKVASVACWSLGMAKIRFFANRLVQMPHVPLDLWRSVLCYEMRDGMETD